MDRAARLALSGFAALPAALVSTTRSERAPEEPAVRRVVRAEPAVEMVEVVGRVLVAAENARTDEHHKVSQAETEATHRRLVARVGLAKEDWEAQDPPARAEPIWSSGT